MSSQLVTSLVFYRYLFYFIFFCKKTKLQWWIFFGWFWNYGYLVEQISSFRESKSDDRKFYIFTATKTLHLRTDSRKDRVAWIQALVSTRSLYPLGDNLSLAPYHVSVSTERLKKRLLEEGSSESVVKECEQIMHSEFSELQDQLKILCQERSNLLDTIRQLEVISILDFRIYLWNASFWLFLCLLRLKAQNTILLVCSSNSNSYTDISPSDFCLVIWLAWYPKKMRH